MLISTLIINVQFYIGHKLIYKIMNINLYINDKKSKIFYNRSYGGGRACIGREKKLNLFPNY